MSIVQALINETIASWNGCQGVPECTLLRMSLLKALTQKLHKEESKFLAKGLRKQAQEFKNWELKIEHLSDSRSLEGDLTTLLEHTANIDKKTIQIPESLFQFIDREKLYRFDRKWEKAIASEAVVQGWSFWSLQLWVKIDHLQAWETHLSTCLWPSGVILFAESVAQQSIIESEDPAESALWKGRWVLILHPQLKHPSELIGQLDAFPELPKNPITAPLLKRWSPPFG